MLRATKPITVLVFLTLLSTAINSFGRTQEENDPAKAEAIIRDAIRARGGDAYLKIRTAISRGLYTPFEKGASGAPMSVIDYLVYPDRERTEFGKGDTKYVQTNAGESGWVYEAKQKMIRDQTEDQIKNVQQSLRYDLDNLLRHGWQEAGAKLVYLGRREVWRNTFAEAVRLTFSDGASVTLHFDPRSKLPLMTEYQTIIEGRTANDQARYFRWVEVNGIQYPTIIDFYREGQQTARVTLDTVEFNAQVADKLFEKPTNIKEIK